MEFELRRQLPREEAPKLTLHYDDRQLPVDGPNDPYYAGSVTFVGRYRTGDDTRAINDQMIRVDDDGESHVQSGTASMLKILRTVVEIEGLLSGGTPVTRLTEDVYDLLPDWMITELSLWSNNINARGRHLAGE